MILGKNMRLCVRLRGVMRGVYIRLRRLEMRKMLFQGLMVGLAVLLVVNLSYATTRTVCATGCGFTTIQEAINASNINGGDTVQVKAGIYTEWVVVDRPVTITGAGVDKSFVVAPYREGNAFTVVAPNVTITGFNIQGGFYGYYDSGIFIPDPSWWDAPSKGKAPVQGATSGNVKIAGCIVEKSSIGILIFDVGNVTLDSNTVRYNTNWAEWYWYDGWQPYSETWAGTGILIGGSDEVDMFNIKLSSNTVSDNDNFGIAVTQHFYPDYYYKPSRSEPQPHIVEDGECTYNRYMDGMQLLSNVLYNNGAWDLYGISNNNSLGFYFHSHCSNIELRGNRILALSSSFYDTPANGNGGEIIVRNTTGLFGTGNLILTKVKGTLGGTSSTLFLPSDDER